jgi:hypothetical protein
MSEWAKPEEQRLPSWEKYVLGAVSIMQEKHDHDHTMQLAVTHRELAAIAFGNVLLNQLMPEFGGVVLELQMKLRELADAQDFLPKDDLSDVVDIDTFEDPTQT